MSRILCKRRLIKLAASVPQTEYQAYLRPISNHAIALSTFSDIE